MELLSFILGLEVNPFSRRVINNKTPLVGFSRLKAQSKQRYDNAIVLRHITQQTHIMLEFFCRVSPWKYTTFHGKKPI